MSGTDELRNETEWRGVERLVKDLKRDGYEVADLKSSTSEAADEKKILLEVER